MSFASEASRVRLEIEQMEPQQRVDLFKWATTEFEREMRDAKTQLGRDALSDLLEIGRKQGSDNRGR